MPDELYVPEAAPIAGSSFVAAVWAGFFRSVRDALATLQTGASGTFTTADAKTVTVVNGRITEIV